MKVQVEDSRTIFKFEEMGKINTTCLSVCVEDAIKASKEILKHYEPESLAVDKFNWEVKEEYRSLINFYTVGNGGCEEAEDCFFLNLSNHSNSYQLDTNSEGLNFKTLFTEEEFLAFAEPLNLEKFFEPVKN